VSSHLSNGVSVQLSFFPPASSSQKCSRHRLEALQDNVTQHCELYVKFLLLTYTGQYDPFVTLLPSGSTNPFTLHSRQRAFSHINADELSYFTLLTLFRCLLTCSDPYRIRSRCPFPERTFSLKKSFLSFHFTRKLLVPLSFSTYDVSTRNRRVFSIYTYPICRDRTTWFPEPQQDSNPFHSGDRDRGFWYSVPHSQPKLTVSLSLRCVADLSINRFYLRSTIPSTRIHSTMASQSQLFNIPQAL
jgi:hypothetical protein